MFVLKNSAVRSRDVIGGKEEPALIVSVEGTPNAPSYPGNIFSYFELRPVYFCLIFFGKFNVTYFSHN